MNWLRNGRILAGESGGPNPWSFWVFHMHVEKLAERGFFVNWPGGYVKL
jgi:hypothetical protein